MSIQAPAGLSAGKHTLGPDNARLTVLTGRSGAIAKVGHDLMLEVTKWTGTLEVSDAVEKYAQHFNFTLVLRFSADELSGQENPEDVMRGLNRQVVYYRPSEDITTAICEFLNRRYQRTAAVPADGAGAAQK